MISGLHEVAVPSTQPQNSVSRFR